MIDRASQALRWAQYDYNAAQDALKRATDDSNRARETLDRADWEYKEIMRGIPSPRAIERQSPSPSDSEEEEPPSKRRAVNGRGTIEDPPYDYNHGGWHTVSRKYRKLYHRGRRPGWQDGDPDFDGDPRNQPLAMGVEGAQDRPAHSAGRPPIAAEAEDEEPTSAS
ncbi:MAG: hypothetical protein OHK93_005345 [Ramalina farinacea]|uniref:Uncharacterized protein n=1 Tax=Ramalina farinacea TaxID=258253 RepID=A0AA43QVX9_9LECA|nr:hypothetical protein [Ramalina farinacea]